MKAMRFSMPNECQLDILFNVDGKGVSRLGNKDKKAASTSLTKVVIEECECVPPPSLCLTTKGCDQHTSALILTWRSGWQWHGGATNIHT